jgi:hypothetical protein
MSTRENTHVASLTRQLSSSHRLSIYCPPRTASLIPEYLVLILLPGAVRAWLFPQPLQGRIVINGFWPMLMLASAGTLFAIPTAS